MIIIWAGFWFAYGTPGLHQWNVWLVTLIISALLL